MNFPVLLNLNQIYTYMFCNYVIKVIGSLKTYDLLSRFLNVHSTRSTEDITLKFWLHQSLQNSQSFISLEPMLEIGYHVRLGSVDSSQDPSLNSGQIYELHQLRIVNVYRSFFGILLDHHKISSVPKYNIL